MTAGRRLWRKQSVIINQEDDDGWYDRTDHKPQFDDVLEILRVNLIIQKYVEMTDT